MAERKPVNNLKRRGVVGEKQQDQVLNGAKGDLFAKISPPILDTKNQSESKVKSAPKNAKKPTEKKMSLPNKNTNKRPVDNKNLAEIKKPIDSKVKENKVNNKNIKTNSKNQGKKKNSKKTEQKPSVKIYFLGGLNEIGKNFTLFECENDMVIVDCGLAFPDDDMLGIDIVIPDFNFVQKNMDRIKGVVITHGHEDHIGAMPYLLKQINVPVYGTPLAMGLLQVKLKEHNLHNVVKLNPTVAGSHIKLGCFDVEMIHVNHSISDAVGLALHTPAGTVVHTGDFKIDFTPTDGNTIDLPRFAELGKQGVLALMADSTNAERAGYTVTEKKVHETLDMLFARAEKKRVIVATFASNISRVQQIINCAIKYNRKVAFSGRSMLNVVAIAKELGYISAPEEVFVDLSIINRYAKEQTVLITTGSQGEPMAALSRMAYAEHRQVVVGEDDFIIISARPIPGNEKTVGTVVDELFKRGCEIVYESMYDVHVSGHACQEELKLIQCLVKPKYFIPVHGEQKHLRKHALLAMQMGMEKENIFIGDVGKGIELNQNFMKQTDDVPAGSIMVDGLGVGDVGSIVLRDRKHLAEDGLIISVCTIDSSTGRVLSGPDIVSRGFVYVRESEELMDLAKKVVFKAIDNCADEGVKEWGAIKMRVKDGLSRLMYEKTRRNPMILPIIMEI